MWSWSMLKFPATCTDPPQGKHLHLARFGSTNGTWFREQRVDEMILQEGDEFRIGEARLVFKSGFAEEA